MRESSKPGEIEVVESSTASCDGTEIGFGIISCGNGSTKACADVIERYGNWSSWKITSRDIKAYLVWRSNNL